MVTSSARLTLAPPAYSYSMTCMAWTPPQEVYFDPAQLSSGWEAQAQADRMSQPVVDPTSLAQADQAPRAEPMPDVEDLLRSDKDPRQVLSRMLQIETRAAGLRALGRALGILQEQVTRAELKASSSQAYYRSVGVMTVGLNADARQAQARAGGLDQGGAETGADAANGEVQDAKMRLAALEKAAVELANPTELMQTLEGLPGNPARAAARDDQSARTAPRKRDLTGSGLETRAVSSEAAASAAESAAAGVEAAQVSESLRQQDIVAYTRTLLDFGRLYGQAGNMPATYQLLSSAIRSDYGTWQQQAPQLLEQFQTAAVFQALSAQRAAEVVALFDQFPLDRQDLSRRIVAQIEGRLNAYGAARSEFIRTPDLAAAIGDLLHTLVEDPDLPRLIPHDDYQRVLKKYARVALDRQFFSEAIGALATAGDTRQLQSLGEKWTRSVVQQRGNVWIVSRDMELGIQAFTEARDFDALRGLLERCRQAKIQLANVPGTVDGAAFLDRDIEKLSNLLEGERALQLSRS